MFTDEKKERKNVHSGRDKKKECSLMKNRQEGEFIEKEKDRG
jgi:hypothetical protein